MPARSRGRPARAPPPPPPDLRPRAPARRRRRLFRCTGARRLDLIPAPPRLERRPARCRRLAAHVSTRWAAAVGHSGAVGGDDRLGALLCLPLAVKVLRCLTRSSATAAAKAESSCAISFASCEWSEMFFSRLRAAAARLSIEPHAPPPSSSSWASTIVITRIDSTGTHETSELRTCTRRQYKQVQDAYHSKCAYHFQADTLPYCCTGPTLWWCVGVGTFIHMAKREGNEDPSNPW